MNTTNIIIVLILIAILIPAVKSSITHMKGEGSCCGGPKEKPIKKRIPGKPIGRMSVHIEGMSCDHCRVRVENRLNELDGVVARVSLAKKLAQVSLYKKVDEQAIRDQVIGAGYEVAAIEYA